MDDEPAHDYSAMMDNPETHWDQPLRFLPRELRVARGERLTLEARHNDSDIDQLRLGGVRRAMLGPVGIPPPRRDIADQLPVVLEGEGV